MRFLAVLVLAASALAPVTTPRLAHAQGDWQVQRDPFDRRVVARYKQLLARNPNDQAALGKLVGLYRRYRSIDQLVEEYEQALARKPGDFAAAVVLGRLALEQGDRDRALSFYQAAAGLDPGNAAVQVALGDLHRQSGQAAEARAAYERALAGKDAGGKRRDLDKQVLRALAELALAQDDVDGARTYYERYLALEPGDVQTRVDLGDALSQHGRHQAAIEVLREAETRLRTDPARQVDVIARIGAAHEAAGDEDEAVRAYRRAMSRVDRTYYLRKELTARIIDIHRRRQTLPALIAEQEKEWPERGRGHLEWDVLARLYEETGDQERAIAAFRAATRKAPHELDTQRRLIALLENAGREDEALAQYENVIRVAPGEPRFQLELAERYWRRGDEKKALELLARIERRFPGDGGVHAAIADLYTRWGKPERALDTYVRLTRIEPDDVGHLINLGEQHFQRGDKKQAMAVWKKLIARKTPDGYARLGDVYAQHDLLSEALVMYEKAVELAPREPEHYKGRAGVYERRRDFPRAVEDWETVLTLLPADGAARPARAEARRRVVSLLQRAHGSHLSHRIDGWKRAFQTDPPDIEAGYFLVEAYLREQRHAQARRTLERLLTLREGDTEAMELLVKVYKREHDYDQAVAVLERLAEQLPARQRDFYDQIAEIMTAGRKDEQAIIYAQKALEHSPGDPVAYQRLAERYAEMQRFDKAMAAYEKAVELDPRNFKASFALAQLYTHASAPGKAAALYREILRRATDEEILSRAGRAAIDLEEMTRTMGELERELAPLSFTYAHKPVYRRILVELYHRYVPGLVRVWRGGTPAQQAAARAELDRLGAHGLKPLLEALGDESDPHQQRIAVAVLGYLGNAGAAAPLVRLATKPAPAAGTPQARLGALTPALEWDVRLDALIAAGHLADERIIDDLVPLSQHRDSTMREAALFALGRTGHRKALPALLAALERNTESDRVLACLGVAQVLARTGGAPGAAAPLVAVVTGRQPAGTRAGDDSRAGDGSRAACAFALGYVAKPGAGSAAHVDAYVDALVDVLDEGNGDLQRLAAWALGRIGDPRAVPALLAAYFSRHAAVRPAVHWALATIAGSGPAPSRPGSSPAPSSAPSSGSPPGISSALGHYPVRLGRYDFQATLAALPGDLGAPGLPANVIAGNEAMLAAGLRDALGRHRDVLVRVLEDLDGAPDHLTLGPLTAGLATAPAPEQARLRQVLDRIGRGILPRLADLVDHRDPTVRGLSLAVLAKIDAPEARDLLRARMDDPEASVRLAAMEAAATQVRVHGQDGPALARAVATQLASESWRTRADAARALGGFGAHADVQVLTRAVADPSAYVREQATLSLGHLVRAGALGGEAAGDALEAMLLAAGDELAVIRLAAARGLATASDPRAREHLRRLADTDPDGEVTRTAREILKKTRN